MIESGEIRRALEMLEVTLPKGGKLEGLKNRYNQLQHDHLQERIDWAEYTAGRQALGEAIKELFRSATSPSVEKQDEKTDKQILTPILVITHHKRQLPILNDFFQKFNFSRVDVYTWPIPVGLDRYKIVVFDNSDLMGERNAEASVLKMEQRQKRADREAQMAFCLNESACYLLHYGNELSWVSGERARTHAANSKFALYARLKEMIDFMEAYRV